MCHAMFYQAAGLLPDDGSPCCLLRDVFQHFAFDVCVEAFSPRRKIPGAAVSFPPPR